MSPTKVALAGATGNLGIPVLNALLNAGFHIAALSRKGGNPSKLPRHENLTVSEVDFTSVTCLTAALQGVEVVISCVATLAMDGQNPLIDASIAAGVRRFIPAEFGMDSLNPWCMQLPVCEPKVATQEYLKQKVGASSVFSWTGIATGLFLDWCLERGLILDLEKHTAVLYNGGDVPFSATTLEDIGRSVVSVIKNQDQSANRILYIHSTATTQNKLIEYAKLVDGKTWDTTVKDTEELKRESLPELTKEGGDVMSGHEGLSLLAMFTPEYGCDFSSHLDNDLLGLRVWSEADLRVLMRKLLG